MATVEVGTEDRSIFTEAGPCSGVIPRRFVAPFLGDLTKPRPVVIGRVAQGDIARDISPDERKKVREVIRQMERGTAALEPKTRGTLVGTVGVRVDLDCRLLAFPHIDGSWHVFYVGRHDYDEAERRMEPLSRAAMQTTALVGGIPVERVTYDGRSASGYVAKGRTILAYRGFGSWGELRDSVQGGVWRSRGRFTVPGEGETQMALRLADVLRGSGMHTLRGTGFLGVIEADIEGLPFRTFLKPSDDPSILQGGSGRFYVNPVTGGGMMYPDQGLGIGIDGGIPLDRIKQVYEIEDGRVKTSWPFSQWESRIDSLEDNPDWAPDLAHKPDTQRVVVMWQGTRGQVHIADDRQEKPVCGATFREYPNKALVTRKSMQSGGGINFWMRGGTQVSFGKPCPKCLGRRRASVDTHPCEVCFEPIPLDEYGDPPDGAVDLGEDGLVCASCVEEMRDHRSRAAEEQLRRWDQRRTAAPRSRGFEFKDMWATNEPLFLILGELPPDKGHNFGEWKGHMHLASAKLTWEDALRPAAFVADLVEAAQAQVRKSFESIGFETIYLVVSGRGAHGDQVTWNIGEMPLNGRQFGPTNKRIEGKYRPAIPSPRAMNAMMYADGEEVRKWLGENLAGVVVDESMFDAVPQVVTVYRGISIHPTQDPLTSSKGDGFDLGHSWTTDLTAAKAISERGMAGFSGVQTLGDTYEIYPDVEESDNRPRKNYLPTVLRAEVTLLPPEQGGPAPYRPWTIDYASEMEIDIPRGTPVTLNGYLQAKKIVRGKGEPDYMGRVSEIVTWRWDDRWVRANVKRVAGLTHTAAFDASPHEDLYPPLFEDEQMRPDVRARLVAHIHRIMAGITDESPGDWGRLWLIGSGASYNWSEGGDLDVQFWVEPTFFVDPQLQLTEIRARLEPYRDHTLADLGIADSPMKLQVYAKLGSGTVEDTLAEHPYAAYDIDNGQWAVFPEPMDMDFYAKLFAEVLVEAAKVAEDISNTIEDADRAISEVEFWARTSDAENQQRALEDLARANETMDALYTKIVVDRQRAYKGDGRGILDPRDTLVKVLEMWGIFSQLKDRVSTLRATAGSVGKLVLYRGEGSHDRPSYYTPKSGEAGGWWTTDLQSALQYAKSTIDGKVYVIEVDESEVEKRGLPQYRFIPDPEVRARRQLYTGSTRTAAMREVWREKGRVGEETHITYEETGTVPTSLLADLHGRRGERPGAHRNRQGEQWEEFKADIAANGITEPIFILRYYRDADWYIAEGSHRRDAAVELGLDEVPVTVRYFGHSERKGLLQDRRS